MSGSFDSEDAELLSSPSSASQAMLGVGLGLRDDRYDPYDYERDDLNDIDIDVNGTSPHHPGTHFETLDIEEEEGPSSSQFSMAWWYDKYNTHPRAFMTGVLAFFLTVTLTLILTASLSSTDDPLDCTLEGNECLNGGVCRTVSSSTGSAGGGGSLSDAIVKMRCQCPHDYINARCDVYFPKSQADTREYGHFILEDNDLEVLVISDTDTDKAAAAMSVGSGSWSDPTNRPGLAHFCEHMLFLGTEKYPDENEYSSYLATHGGGANAYTSEEETNYFFDVDQAALQGALDRFAQFFIAPLFTESATQRELHAIDSENQKNLLNDGWRMWQLMKSTSNPKFPFHHFGTGNSDTLNSPDVRGELLSFHRKHYSANRMKLTVLGSESVEALTRLVQQTFHRVPNHNAPEPTYQPDEYDTSGDDGEDTDAGSEEREKPFSVASNTVGRFFKVAPIKPEHSLVLTWACPPLSSYSSTSSFSGSMPTTHNPDQYLSYLLGHEAEGSVLYYLKSEKGWATSLQTSTDIDSRSFSLFLVEIQLTEAGVANLEAVLEAVFAHLNLIREEAVSDDIWREMLSLEELNYRFKDKAEPIDYVSSLSSRMNDAHPSLSSLLNSPSSKRFNEKSVRNLLSYLTADVVNVYASSPLFTSEGSNHQTLNLKEQWYDTLYRVDELTPRRKQELKEVRLPEDTLHLPPSNPFIPASLDLTPAQPEDTAHASSSSSGAVYVDPPSPSKVLDTEGVRVWWKRDVSTFKSPKTYLKLDILAPKHLLAEHSSPARQHARLVMYVEMVKASLASTSYLAQLSGYAYNIAVTSTGFRLSVSGYSDKLAVFLKAVVKELVQPSYLNQFHFQVEVNRLKVSLSSFSNEQSYQHALYFHDLLTQKEKVDNIALLTELELMKWTDLVAANEDGESDSKTLLPSMFAQLFIESLVFGNVDKEQALALVHIVTDAFEDTYNTSPIAASTHSSDSASDSDSDSGNFPTTTHVVKIPAAENVVAQSRTLNQDNTNSATLLAFQTDVNSNLRSTVLGELLGSMIREPCFNQLRTKEQLGYVVFCWARSAFGVTSLSMLVQGAVHGGAYLEERMEAFIHQYNSFLADELTSAELELNKQSLLSEYTQKPLSLSEQNTRYWGEIISHRYLFDQRAQKSALLASITLADVRSAFNTWVTDRSSRRKLSVELFGNGFETRQPFTPQVPASIPILPDNYTRSEGGDDVVDYAVLEQAFMQMGDRIAFQSGKETFDTLAVNNAH